MKLISVAYYSAIRTVKDIKTLLIIVGALLLIIILGVSTDQFYAPSNLDQAEVAFLNEDKGAAAARFEEFLADETVNELLNIRAVADYDEGVALLDDGSIEAFLYLPEGFTRALDKGEGAEITLLSNRRHSFVKSLIENYLHTVNGAYAVYAVGGKAGGITGRNSHVEPMAITTDGKKPRAIDYYAVQTLLQVLMLGAFFGIAAIQEDEEKNTLVRIKSAPVKPSEIIIGRTLANILVLYGTAVIVMAFSKFVYKANWGGSLIINLSVLLIFVVLVTGMGMLLGVAIKNSGTAIAVMVVLMMFFSVTGGAISEYMTEGPLGQILVKFSPNHYAATAIFNNIYAGSGEAVRSSIFILSAIAAGIYAITFLIGRRRFI